MIDFFTKEDLRAVLSRLMSEGVEGEGSDSIQKVEDTTKEIEKMDALELVREAQPLTEEEKIMAEDKPAEEEEDDSLYSVTNFSI